MKSDLPDTVFGITALLPMGKQLSEQVEYHISATKVANLLLEGLEKGCIVRNLKSDDSSLGSHLIFFKTPNYIVLQNNILSLVSILHYLQDNILQLSSGPPENNFIVWFL